MCTSAREHQPMVDAALEMPEMVRLPGYSKAEMRSIRDGQLLDMQ
jgi:hypothetical protein